MIAEFPAAAVRWLYHCYSPEWTISRADLDTWVAYRKLGTARRVLAGEPEELLRKLDMEPAAAGAIVWIVPAGHLSGGFGPVPA
jgi:hypothetical protein